MENKGKLTRGILRENYGTKEEIINSFRMHEGGMSREQFLAKLIKEKHVLGYTYLSRQHKVLFETVNGFGIRYILDDEDFDDEVSFMIGISMILKG